MGDSPPAKIYNIDNEDVLDLVRDFGIELRFEYVYPFFLRTQPSIDELCVNAVFGSNGGLLN